MLNRGTFERGSKPKAPALEPADARTKDPKPSPPPHSASHLLKPGQSSMASLLNAPRRNLGTFCVTLFRLHLSYTIPPYVLPYPSRPFMFIYYYPRHIFAVLA